MKTYVFLARSGELIEAHRISFFDHDGNLPIGKEVGEKTQYAISLRTNAHDGWILYHPEMAGGMTLFMNLEAENLMENLGEL